MLTIMHPSVLRMVHELPVGLMPVTLKADSIPKLIVKTSKEAILTAKMRQGFSIYLIPYEVRGVKSVGFLAAFFDDKQSPYTTGGALIKELMGRELSKLFLSPQVDVHFFDELGREMLGYRAEFRSTKKHRDLLRGAVLPSVHGLNQSAVLNEIGSWFSLSGLNDDAAAISVTFKEAIIPEDIFYVDMRPESQSYHGSSGFSSTMLEREEPGPLQEKEIVALLQRTFDASGVYLSPKRVYDKEEMADILVVTRESVIIVQAKDSPNIERVLNNSIERKRATTNKALKKAVGQVKGAVNYLSWAPNFVVLVDDEEVEIDLTGKRVYSLVVVKELFDDDYDVYTPPMLELYEEVGVECIPLSYTELHQYTRFLQGDKAFYEAFKKVFDHGMATKMFPRLRVHPPGTTFD